MKEPNTLSADAKFIAVAILTAAQMTHRVYPGERFGMDDEAAVRYAFANLADILASSIFTPQTSDKPNEVDNDEADLKHCHGC
ncbi:MAG: hypothetical protein ACO3YZ_03505 [Candidatus Nanopelagicaceae bacterium]